MLLLLLLLLMMMMMMMMMMMVETIPSSATWMLYSTCIDLICLLL